MSVRRLEITVVEDNSADLAWLACVLDEVGLPYRLTIASDGEQAVDCLLRRGKFEEAPVADFILLDMHLPKFGGLEILRRVPGSSHMPVCALTDSREEEKQLREHFQKPISSIIKPVTSKRLLECLRSQKDLKPFVDPLEVAP